MALRRITDYTKQLPGATNTFPFLEILIMPGYGNPSSLCWPLAPFLHKEGILLAFHQKKKVCFIVQRQSFSVS